MSSSSFARILPGSLCITLLRSDPRNAGRIVQVLAHEGKLPDVPLEDAYCIAAVDRDRLLSLFEIDENGDEVSVPDGHIAYVDRKYLRLLTPPSQAETQHADIALTARSITADESCGVS